MSETKRKEIGRSIDNPNSKTDNAPMDSKQRLNSTRRSSVLAVLAAAGMTLLVPRMSEGAEPTPIERETSILEKAPKGVFMVLASTEDGIQKAAAEGLAARLLPPSWVMDHFDFVVERYTPNSGLAMVRAKRKGDQAQVQKPSDSPKKDLSVGQAVSIPDNELFKGQNGLAGTSRTKIEEKKTVEVSKTLASETPVTKPLDAETLREFRKRDSKAVQSCYERELKRNPILKGKIVVRITVGTDGRAQVSFRENSLRNMAVEQCIAEVVSKWAFDKNDAGYSADIPFVLAPKSN